MVACDLLHAEVYTLQARRVIASVFPINHLTLSLLSAWPVMAGLGEDKGASVPRRRKALMSADNFVILAS